MSRKKKAIKAADIKAMVKLFQLDEMEIAHQINEATEHICFDIQNILLYGTSIREERAAVCALLIYFGGKLQKENDLRRALDITCCELENVLKCGSWQAMQWLKSISMTEDRFGRHVECSDIFGLNYLEIE